MCSPSCSRAQRLASRARCRVFSHLWSIAVEEQFYLFWPLLLALVARGPNAGRNVAVVAATGALVSPALMIDLTDPIDTTRVYEGTDTRAFSLLLGALTATAPAARAVARLGEHLAGWISVALVCGIGAYWALADGEDSPSLFQGACSSTRRPPPSSSAASPGPRAAPSAVFSAALRCAGPV
ncbi:acyltransferase family protein [Embleya sp. NPDC008237]|uniref:acyltransferase family protein n=1 Tax=Embleya sp. NPDC008237 TaxID=3363978 RepID=UPI0036E3FFFD